MEWGRRRKTSCQAALLLKRSHFRAGLTRTRGGHTINFPASKSRQSLFRILINKRVSQRERMNGNAFFSDQALTPMTTRKRGFRNHFFFKTLKSQPIFGKSLFEWNHHQLKWHDERRRRRHCCPPTFSAGSQQTVVRTFKQGTRCTRTDF